MMEDNSELLEVYCGNLVDVDFVKSILESEEIETFLGNESFASWYTVAGKVSDVKIFVREEDWERADAIIADMEEHLYDQGENES